MGDTFAPTSEQTLPGTGSILHPGGGVLQRGAILSSTYEVRGLLGEGGMGQVYEAHDLCLNRLVAIKVAWPGLPSIKREAQALAIMQHPSLPAVHAFGHHDELEYVVMERVFGVSLKQRLTRRLEERERFSAEEVIEVLAAIAEALDVVHRAGVVHRDVKPANVMLAPRGRVVLMDFGTVLPACDIGRDRRVMGTPEYIAPEAATERIRASWAHLVDLYALGVTAFELLTGATPFAGRSSMATMLAHVNEPAPDVRAHREDVPAPLAALIQDLLAKSPEDRPPTAEDVLARLRTNGDRESRRARPYEVVIVDDHRELAEALAACARHSLPGAHARVATSAEAALRLIDERPPDLLVVDLELPGMNGLELCMYLQGTGRRMRVLVVSGKAQRPDAQVLAQLGVDQMITKTHGFMDRFRAALARVAARR